MWDKKARISINVTTEILNFAHEKKVKSEK